jgi:hypothetical protein
MSRTPDRFQDLSAFAPDALQRTLDCTRLLMETHLRCGANYQAMPRRTAAESLLMEVHLSLAADYQRTVDAIGQELVRREALGFQRAVTCERLSEEDS